jgi:hemerythrin
MGTIKKIEWTNDLILGIPEIDEQHKQIVDYINKLVDVRGNPDRKVTEEVVSELIGYTVSHFGFEESLMEQANYSYIEPHKRIHRLFEKRVKHYAERFVHGEEITEELIQMLYNWLIGHIRAEDKDYSPLVLASLNKSPEKERFLKKALGKFFPGRGK